MIEEFLNCQGILAQVWDPLFESTVNNLPPRDVRGHLEWAALDVSGSYLESMSLKCPDAPEDVPPLYELLLSAHKSFEDQVFGPEASSVDIAGHHCLYGFLPLAMFMMRCSPSSSLTWQQEHARLLASAFRHGYFDFIGSTRWSFVSRIDVDILIACTIEYSTRDEVDICIASSFARAAAAATEKVPTLLPVAQMTWDANVKVSPVASRECDVCFVCDHPAQCFGWTSLVGQAFDRVPHVDTRFHALGDNKNMRKQWTESDLCLFLQLCNAQQVAESYMDFLSDFYSYDEELLTEAYSNKQSKLASPYNLTRALDLLYHKRRPQCDLVVDSCGFFGIILSTFYPSAHVLLWVCMGRYTHGLDSQMSIGEFAYAHRQLAANPRHVFFATTEKLVVQTAWQIGVVPVLCEVPMLHVPLRPRAAPVSQILVWAAEAMHQIKPVFSLFQQQAGLREFFYKPHRKTALPFEVLFSFEACVFVPWNPHSLLFMEFYAANVPLFVPDGSFVYALQRTHAWHDQIESDYGTGHSRHLRSFPVDALTGQPPDQLRRQLLDVPSPFWPAGAVPPLDMAERFAFVWQLSPMRTYDSVIHFDSIPGLFLEIAQTDLNLVKEKMVAFHATLAKRSLDTVRIALLKILAK